MRLMHKCSTKRIKAMLLLHVVLSIFRDIKRKKTQRGRDEEVEVKNKERKKEQQIKEQQREQ